MFRLLLIILVLSLGSCTNISYNKIISSEDYFRLQKSECMLNCPASDFIIHKTGRLFYKEKDRSKYTIEISGKISRKINDSLWSQINAVLIEDPKGDYRAGPEDIQLKIMYFSNNSVIKKIHYKRGEPLIIRELEKKITTLLMDSQLSKDTTLIELNQQ